MNSWNTKQQKHRASYYSCEWPADYKGYEAPAVQCTAMQPLIKIREQRNKSYRYVFFYIIRFMWARCSFSSNGCLARSSLRQLGNYSLLFGLQTSEILSLYSFDFKTKHPLSPLFARSHHSNHIQNPHLKGENGCFTMVQKWFSKRWSLLCCWVSWWEKNTKLYECSARAVTSHL